MYWENAQLVIDFEGPDSCPAIEFRCGSLPFEPSDNCKELYSNEGWYTELWCWDVPKEDMPEEFRQYNIPYGIYVYYASQFTRGGNAILLDDVPEELEECEINGHQALKFHATQDVNGYHFDYNYILLFSEENGYMIVINGNSPMSVMEEIAGGLEIRLLDRSLSYDDFEEHNVFIDASVG